MKYIFKNIGFKYLTPLFMVACNTGITSNSSTSGCPDKPTATLNEDDVENIVLSDKTLSKSGEVNATKSVGYKFEAEAGQKFSYSTDSDICVWRYSPDNQILKDRNLPQTGKYIIQVSAPRGSRTFDLKMTLGVLEASSTPIPSASPTYSPPSTTNLTQKQALEIVERWYAAKSEIFAPPFNTNLVDELATGKLYRNTINSDPKLGPIAWLKANNSYYKYNQSDIKKVISFSNDLQQPNIRVTVIEELYLYGRNGKIDRDQSGTFENSFIYFFKKDSSGEWKISEYQKVS